MNNNIDQLRTEVDEIKNSLNSLKNDVNLSESEKKTQADLLKAQAETTKGKIQQEISALESQTDATAQQKLEEARALLQSFNNITTLYESITSGSTNPPAAPQPGNENKNMFVKAKDWVGNQWYDIWDKSKWKSETGSNLLRTAGFVATGVGAGALIYKGFKELFGKEARERRKKKKEEKRKQKEKEKAERAAAEEDDEEEESTSNKKKKKKSFWDRWYGKAIKWTGIGTGIYYIAHGISTGKWDLSHFFDWKHNGPTSTAEENFDNYIELMQENPEKYREYEKIGENINLMYDQIRDTEKNYFGANSQIVMGAIGDKAKEQKIKKNEKFENIETRGLVPYSLDNFFNNVGDMLSYGGVNRYIRSKNIEEYQQKIKSFGAEWFDKAMVPFLSGFANFASFGILSTDTAQQKMDKYFKGVGDHAEENLEILDLFFRQYTKVLTYMADKKNALALKYAREIIAINGYDNDSRPSDTEKQKEMLYEAINDSDWVEKNLKHTKYGAFLSSNIVGACRILKEEGLDNTEITEELHDIVEGVDSQTSKLVGGFDNNAFNRAESKLNNGETLDGNDKDGLKKIADNLIKDLGDTTNGSRMYYTFDYIFEGLGLEEADKQTILEESGLNKCLQGTVKAIADLSSDIYNNPTKENVEKLKNLVGEYTSMKKELAVALYAMKEAKEDKDLLDYILQIAGAIGTLHKHFFESVCDLFKGRADIGDFINIFIGATVVGTELKICGKLLKCKPVYVTGHYMKKFGLIPVTLTEMGLGHTKRSWAVKNRINDLAKTNPTKAENLMKKKILDGVLSKKHVSKILQSNESMKAAFNITGFQNNDRVFKEVVYNIFGGANQAEADLFIKYYGKVNGLVSYTRESMSNGGFTDGKFRMQIDTDGFKVLKDFDAEFDKLGNTVQKSYFEQMLKKVKNSDDMKLLNEFINNDTFKSVINNSNIDKLKKLNISQLRIFEESGLLDDLLSNTKNIDQVMDQIKVIEEMPVSEIRSTFRGNIDDAIKKLKQSTANIDAVKQHIKNLKKLKYDFQLIDEDMGMFSKFLSKGFDAKIIPDIKKVLSITDTFSTGEKIGEKMKNLLSDGNFSEFKGLLNNPSYARKFDNLGITKVVREGIVDNFDNVLRALGHTHITSQGAKTAVKTFFKIIGKIL